MKRSTKKNQKLSVDPSMAGWDRNMKSQFGVCTKMQPVIPPEEKRVVFRSQQDRVKPRSALKELADQMLEEEG